MKIIRNIVVKQILTEKSKQELFIRFEQQIEQLNKEIGQLRFEKKKYEKTKKAQASLLDASRFDKEISGRIEKCKLLQFQLEQLEILPVGTELKESEVQGIVEINEGDNWEELTKERTIVIKDGIIEEIR
ncbi:YlqD protein [Schinkia azotoformans MEV2011]|uniref:YlqD protein n=1 Tax=Schinkia azotoformans MEV2011 TaxID=1348973 RepID=A0A072P2Z6_SCHAZ|nr:YlqD family protein [Schinkia azotoformans]KEF39855.1 YlqD protein [Schinkia azotoformans MEV2011]MEC1697153.1 YlqD family protein [Schinkia azotoformans]MEC1715314.1 YlqD family protein [Schinkia azotoformans]MEC1724192.1 YlqD family protein [Schinkia azotoformans]MEC1740935.1 YlqD family protein [Schinkia azotoformans]